MNDEDALAERRAEAERQLNKLAHQSSSFKLRRRPRGRRSGLRKYRNFDPETDTTARFLWRVGLGGFVVYWLYDTAGELLYVGMTGNPRTRIKDHHLNQPWGDEIDVVVMSDLIEHEHEARHEEREAIRLEDPRYNKIGRGYRT